MKPWKMLNKQNKPQSLGEIERRKELALTSCVNLNVFALSTVSKN